MLGLPETRYWELTPRALHALALTQQQHAQGERTYARELLQWTIGVHLEYVLQALRAKTDTGRDFEPADFYPLPTRAALRAARVEHDADDGRAALLTMASFTLAAGGRIPDHVQRALQEN